MHHCSPFFVRAFHLLLCLLWLGCAAYTEPTTGRAATQPNEGAAKLGGAPRYFRLVAENVAFDDTNLELDPPAITEVEASLELLEEDGELVAYVTPLWGERSRFTRSSDGSFAGRARFYRPEDYFIEPETAMTSGWGQIGTLEALDFESLQPGALVKCVGLEEVIDGDLGWYHDFSGTLRLLEDKTAPQFKAQPITPQQARYLQSERPFLPWTAISVSVSESVSRTELSDSITVNQQDVVIQFDDDEEFVTNATVQPASWWSANVRLSLASLSDRAGNLSAPQEFGQSYFPLSSASEAIEFAPDEAQLYGSAARLSEECPDVDTCVAVGEASATSNGTWDIVAALQREAFSRIVVRARLITTGGLIPNKPPSLRAITFAEVDQQPTRVFHSGAVEVEEGWYDFEYIFSAPTDGGLVHMENTVVGGLVGPPDPFYIDSIVVR